MVLHLLDIQPDDEVIVPAYTYTATASVTQHVGCKLVLVDSQKDNVGMDYDKLAAAITEKTKVIAPVDLGGIVADYDRVFEIVEAKKGLFKPNNALQAKIGRIVVSADCAHSFGANRKGKMAGEIADFSSFSFHAVKNFSGWRWGQMPYTYRGCPYYKNESTTQVMPQEMYEERLRAAKPEKFAWERQEADGVSLADLDEKRISGTVRLGVERGRMPATAEAESVESLLSKWNLMREGKVLNGAVALFGKNLSGYTQMSLRLARFRGTDKNEFVDSGRADGNFFDLLDAGMAFLFKHLSQSGKIVGFQKEEHLEIPAEALREALTNALCHRQLEKYNLTPSIAVYDDRVEIENPGRLPFDLTPETIKSAHASYPYNPLIAEVLFKSSFLESWGSGVGRMVDACRAQGVPEPEYEVAGGFVKMIFRKSFAASGQSRA